MIVSTHYCDICGSKMEDSGCEIELHGYRRPDFNFRLVSICDDCVSKISHHVRHELHPICFSKAREKESEIDFEVSKPSWFHRFIHWIRRIR